MRRVMTLLKARSTHGLPFSVSVVSWTLLLVLLLSSSFSHIHRRTKQDTEEFATDRIEFRRNARDGGACPGSSEYHNPVLDKGQGYSRDYRSPLQLVEASEQDWLDTNSGGDLIEEGDVLADRSVVSPVIPPTTGVCTLDALQYAEYGAGLLQTSGAAEGSSKSIQLSYQEGCYSSALRGDIEFPGQECALPQLEGDFVCSEEFSAEELWQPVDVLRELEPGESLLVCRRNSVSGTTSCYFACSSITQCFKTGVNSRFTHYERSLFNLLYRTPAVYQRIPRYWLTSSESLRSELVDRSSSGPDLGHVQILEADSTLRTPAGDGSGDRAVDLYPKEDTVHSENNGRDVVDQVTDTTLPATNELQDVADQGDARPLAEVNTRNQRLEDNVQSSTKVYSDDNKDSGIDEDKGLSAPAQQNIGIIKVIDVLTEEMQKLQTYEEAPLDEKPITFAGLDNGVLLELVKPRRVGSVMSLEEYKKSVLEKQQKLGQDVNLSIVQSQKQRQSDESYNYADSAHGAKVLSSNKEAKGPRHVISSDKDKYLRNPCSAEDKYVVLELSEETFVDTLVVANFEFHSANLKDFEVLGSPVYPAKEWILLGKFRAENVRHRQKFSIEDPKLVRYLKLKMLTHWGSEFFCTLSAVEVYGVDVIKNLLDDWIAQEGGENIPRTQMNGPAVHHEETAPESLQGSVGSSDVASVVPLDSLSVIELGTRLDAESNLVKEKRIEGSSREDEPKAVDTGLEIHYPVGGKTPGDSVLKILMQKVKALESSQTLFYNYLEDMNFKYKAMLSELDKDLVLITERARNEAAVSASLAMRLVELEVKRREERAYVEHEFALIAANFTENTESMRWQIQSMERRELTAVILALVCLILSGLLHLLASCLARRACPKNYMLQEVGEDIDEPVNPCSMSSACNRSSSIILYLASGLTVLVLTV